MAKPEPLTVGSVEELIGILQSESEKRKVAQKYLGLALGSIALLFLTAVVVIWVRSGHYPSDLGSFITCFGGLFGITAVASSTHRSALKLAAESDDPRLTGYLLEATTLNEPKLAKMARETLAPRLSLLIGPEDLTKAHREFLYRSVLGPADERYTKAGLEAIRRVGDREAIPFLESFLRLPPSRTPKAVDQ